MVELPASDPAQRGFTPKVLDKTVIAIPLLDRLAAEKESRAAARKDRKRYPTPLIGVIIDLHLAYPGGRDKARDRVIELVRAAVAQVGTKARRAGAAPPPAQGVNRTKTKFSNQYVFAKLEPDVIRRLVVLDTTGAPDPDSPSAEVRVQRSIYRIWPDFSIGKLTVKSISTVKADAARVSFAAFGHNIVWAVVDSGIQRDHPHFEKYDNLTLQEPLEHCDFTAADFDTADDGDTDANADQVSTAASALVDEFGHGTHVAGIIAGAMSANSAEAPGQPPPDGAAGAAAAPPPPPSPRSIRAVSRHRDENGDVTFDMVDLPEISGMAPQTKLVSLKVLDENGQGEASSLIAAIALVQRINGYGRDIKIHGVNLSVGYEFQPEWFACGQSPLCVEVDLLVRSGVVVVVAAGNTGYGYNQDAFKGTAVPAGLDVTINDPGNAELAITVGSTHREMPHVYGVSYFSSKGPTGDGRVKPDLVAPGEKILSCAAGEQLKLARDNVGECEYVEDSGTSMAAPHVSGVIAAFLSVRREFIGRPERVKEIFLSSATDLRRDRNFQGCGLVDLMRAIQSV